MPHFFTSRPRKFAIGADPNNRRVQFVWGCVNAIAYELGGFIFIAGSVFFLPQCAEYAAIGSWLFVVGSWLYMIVSCHDLIEEIWNPSATKPMDVAAVLSYIIGSILYIMGSIFFLPQIGNTNGGAWTFILGSILFLVGAVINSMQIFEATAMWVARFENLTAACYVIGSTMFLCGSIPYLDTFDDDKDEETVYNYLAFLFIIGSVFFLLGGTINFAEADLVMKNDKKRLAEEKQNEDGTTKDNGPVAMKDDDTSCLASATHDTVDMKDNQNEDGTQVNGSFVSEYDA